MPKKEVAVITGASAGVGRASNRSQQLWLAENRNWLLAAAAALAGAAFAFSRQRRPKEELPEWRQLRAA